jgi:F-type H+-transporting ATPase subunit a
MSLAKYLSAIRKLSSYFLIVVGCFYSPYAVCAEEAKKDFIMHHISDSHEWHFATIGQTPITLALPIILVSKDRGLEVFLSSSLLDHQQQRITYNGYQLDDHDHIVDSDASRKFYDLSITKNIAFMWISVVILLMILLLAARRSRKHLYTPPKGFGAFLELMISFIKDDIAIPNIGQQHYMRFLPYLLSIFFFIWFNNLLGLLPGAANVTGNISITLVLAGFTFVITAINANKGYWGHLFNPPGVPKWLAPIMVPVEILGLFTKPFSLMIRLFANITAGHIILLSIISLIFIFKTAWAGLLSVPFGIFMFLLKLLVAFLQAYIFTLLSAIYFGMAVEESH